ncbi:MAG: hypothetical protein WBH03_05840, partial [Cyclobacteriaceae bacterium]
MKISITLTLLLLSQVLYAQERLTDWLSAPGTESADPANFYEYDGNLYFTAYHELYGTEIWKYDGQSDPALLRDIRLQTDKASLFTDPVEMDGNLYFRASDQEYGWQVWRTDGTEQGTIRVTDLPNVYDIDVADSLLIINTAAGSASGYHRLYVYDGMEGEPELIRDDRAYDFNKGGSAGGYYFFDIRIGATTYVWRTNGTAEGTMMVAEGIPLEYIPSGDRMLIVLKTSPLLPEGTETGLVSTDGTPENTSFIAGLTNNYVTKESVSAVTINGDAYISLHARSAREYAVYRTDGTAAGTNRLNTPSTDLRYNTASSLYKDGDNLVYIWAGGPNTWAVLHTYNTVTETYSTLTLQPDEVTSNPYRSYIADGGSGRLVVGVPDRNYLVSADKMSFQEITSDFSVQEAIHYQGDTYSRATVGDAGSELAVIRENSSTVELAADVNAVPFSAFDHSGITLFEDNGLLYINPDRQDVAEDYFLYDPSNSQFSPLSFPEGLPESGRWFTTIHAGDYNYYIDIINNEAVIRRINVFDKTVSTVEYDFGSVEKIDLITGFQNKLYFTVKYTDGPVYLYTVDNDGTVVLVDRLPLASLPTPPYIATHSVVEYDTTSEYMYYVTYDRNATPSPNIDPAYFSYVLFRTDGTPEGTIQLARSGVTVGNLTPVGNKLYFAETFTLWVTDGTQQGTTEVEPDGSNMSVPQPQYEPIVYQDYLVYGFGRDLIITDGTVENARRIENFYNGPGEYQPSSEPFPYIIADSTLYLAGNDGVHGLELFKLEGPEGDLQLEKDINPGPASSYPSSFAADSSTIYFSAYTEANGYEVWYSGGMEDNTQLLYDVIPGAVSSEPSDLVVIGENIYFLANTSAYG